MMKQQLAMKSLDVTTRIRSAGLVLIILLLSTGCDSSNSYTELEQYVTQIKLGGSNKAEPLPDDLVELDYRYLGHGKRSPFVTPRQYVMSQVEDNSEKNQPAIDRPKEILEEYDLSELKMVGSLQKNDGSYWGLVKDKNDIVHKVKVGNFLGKNYGEIVNVSDNEIEVKESVSNSYGGWIRNTVIIELDR